MAGVSSAGRGYDFAHQKLRRQVARVVESGRAVCARCKLPIRASYCLCGRAALRGTRPQRQGLAPPQGTRAPRFNFIRLRPGGPGSGSQDVAAEVRNGRVGKRTPWGVPLTRRDARHIIGPRTASGRPRTHGRKVQAMTMVSTRAFTARYGDDDVAIRMGEFVADGHELVKKYPQNFETENNARRREQIRAAAQNPPTARAATATSARAPRLPATPTRSARRRCAPTSAPTSCPTRRAPTWSG